MLNWLHRSVAGIDVSDRSLEAVWLKRAWGKAVVAAYARQELPAGVVEAGRILEPSRLVSQLRELLSSARPEPIRDHQCLVSLPESQVFSHVFGLPAALPNDQAHRVILAEAEQFLPLPLRDCYYDFVPLGSADNQQEILFVAARRGLVHQYLEVFSAAGLLAIAFEPESWSLARALVRHGMLERGQTVLVIDLGARTTNAHLVWRGAVAGSFTIPLAGEHLTQAVAAALKLPPAEAEAKKNFLGLRGDSREGQAVTAALLPVLQPLINELNRYLEYARVQRHLTVSQAVLTGGTALLPGIAGYLAPHLGLPVKLGNPLARLRGGRVQLPEERAALFAAVVGLALRGVAPHPERRGLNLLSQAQARIKSDKLQRFLTWPQFDPRLISLIAALAIGLLVLGGLVWYRVRSPGLARRPALEPPPAGFLPQLLRVHRLRFAFGDGVVVPPGALPARWLQTTLQARETFAATGTTTETLISAVTVTLVNRTARARALVRQTRLQVADGTMWRLRDPVVVPAQGQVDVVIPLRAGSSPPAGGRVTVPGLPLALQSAVYGEIGLPRTEARNVSLVSPEDVAAAQTALRLELERQARDGFVARLSAREMVLPLMLPVAPADFSTDLSAPAAAERFTATLKLTLGGLAVDRDAVSQAIRDAFGPLPDPLTAASFTLERLDLENKEVSVIIESAVPPVEK